MKALENKNKTADVWRSLYNDLVQDTVNQIKPFIQDGCTLNISDDTLDSLWWYWLDKFYFEDRLSKHYLDYRWDGEWERSYIKYEYIRKFLDWLEDVDIDDIDKMLSEE